MSESDKAEIVKWLERAGLSQYSQCFVEENISRRTLKELTEADLKSIGVDKLGDRKRILQLAQRDEGLEADSGSTPRNEHDTTEESPAVAGGENAVERTLYQNDGVTVTTRKFAVDGDSHPIQDVENITYRPHKTSVGQWIGILIFYAMCCVGPTISAISSAAQGGTITWVTKDFALPSSESNVTLYGVLTLIMTVKLGRMFWKEKKNPDFEVIARINAKTLKVCEVPDEAEAKQLKNAVTKAK